MSDKTLRDRRTEKLLSITDEYGPDWSDLEREEIETKFRAVLADSAEEGCCTATGIEGGHQWQRCHLPMGHEGPHDFRPASADAPEGPQWTRKAPDVLGTWVRINAAGKPQLHEVFETQGGELSLEDGLWLSWGWGGSQRLVHPGPQQAKFLWFGPLPLSDDDRLDAQQKS